MSNFRFIKLNENVDKVLGQVLSNESDWQFVSTLTGVGGNRNPYGFLPLVMAVVEKEGDLPKDTHLQQKTPLYKKYSEIRKWLRRQGVMQTSRAAFFRLKVGGRVGRHIDDGSYYLTRDRYHFSLQGTYDYEVDGEWHRIEPGTFFWFDNKKHHQAINVGDVERITFVFDVPHSEKNP